MTQPRSEVTGAVPEARTANDEPAEGAALRWTPSVEELRNEFRGMAPVVAGELIAVLLRRHPDYVDEAIRNELLASQSLTTLGSQRPAEEHLDIASQPWDPIRAPVFTGRHVILGLALDGDVGWSLLRSGVIGSLLSQWQPGTGEPEEPYRPVWDVLTATGRELVEEQPLLAAAFGAPAEWSVAVPDSVRAIAWSSDGDRLAILAGTNAYEVRPGNQPQLINDVGESAVSIGYGSAGVVVLTIADGTATLVRAVDGSALGDESAVTAGLLSGDGSHAWLVGSNRIDRWAPGEGSSRLTSATQTEPVAPLALDRAGRLGLIRTRHDSILVAALPTGLLPASRLERDPSWPEDAAPMVGWTYPRQPPCSLVRIGDDQAVASVEPDGLHVDLLPGTPVCRIAAGSDEVTALATDASGTRLAVGTSSEISVWPLSRRAASARAVPAYDSDLATGADLLDADRDAQAIAALVASEELRPPLSIGLFGAWGSGKSFILDQVNHTLSAEDKPAGYLQRIKVVEFNAWHYAEANLWASLVDQVLVAIAPVASPAAPPEVIAAKAHASEVTNAAGEASRKVAAADESLTAATTALVKRRRQGAWLMAAVLALLTAAIVVAILGGPDLLIAGVTAIAGLIGSAATVLQSTRRTTENAKELATASRAGLGGLDRLLGRPEALTVEVRRIELQELLKEKHERDEEKRRADAELSHITTLARDQPLGTMLHRLSTITDYRDQLSLVTRTREHFRDVDKEISRSRKDKQAELERVVIVIDDLDRCPPEKVVNVLEAVHLLFSFEMFVVLIAVDTRWLEQSLRMKYRQLLGRAGTAAPTDYLEKIIQVPLHLRPLDSDMIRRMITGLARTSGVGAQPTSETAASTADNAGETTGPSGAQQLVASMPRTPRGPLAAEVLTIGEAQGAAMAAVAPLIGNTPRTVKRFVNTYRLLKARARDIDSFDEIRDGLGDHQVVAFLLAVVTGHPAAAARLLPELRSASAELTALAAVNAVDSPDVGTELAASLAVIREWLSRKDRYAAAPARRYGDWADEVGRFTFIPPR